MESQKLKSHPLEAECDRVVTDLGGDLTTMKHVTDTGTTYTFVFSAADDGGIAAYLALPVYVPSRSDNLFRLEFTVGEVEAEDLGRTIFTITLDMDLQRYSVLRVVPRTKDHRSFQIILQCVCAVDLVREGFIGSTVIAGLELAQFYRTEFLMSKSKVA